MVILLFGEQITNLFRKKNKITILKKDNPFYQIKCNEHIVMVLWSTTKSNSDIAETVLISFTSAYKIKIITAKGKGGE